MEGSLSQMGRVQWEKIEDMSDVSPYIKEVKETLKANFMRIKEEMEPTYLTFYMNKIVSLAANKLIQNIYKCKKLPLTAYQFLQMDITEIKETLVSVVKADQSTPLPTQGPTPTPRTSRTTSPSSTKASANPKTSSNSCSSPTRSSANATKCSWRAGQCRTWRRSCRCGAARRATSQLWPNRWSPGTFDGMHIHYNSWRINTSF